MQVQDLLFATVEQFYEGGFDVDDILQLSRGRFDFASTQADVDGVLLQWNRTGARFRSREVYRGSGVMFGFVLRGRGTFKSYGHELGYGDAVVWQPRQELEYVAPPGVTSLIVHVDSALVDLLGWNLTGTLWRRVPASHLQRLTETCCLATRAARRQIASAGNESQLGSRLSQDWQCWRDRILADLEVALEPWMASSSTEKCFSIGGNRHFRLVREAERFFAQYDLGEPLTVNDVAKALGVPRRTLFHAFRKWLGVGPHTYLTLVRLHRLRDRLLKGSPEDTCVSQVASELGFGHFGRLSASYREHFCEYPSDTLKRV